jgi:sterol desaturase/sphingolipid hydroxylase (fatty acid hydroxylase superfamily)
MELSSGLSSIAAILVAMAFVAGLEAFAPFRARGAWSRAHLGPNLALTAITFAANLLFNVFLLALLLKIESSGFGLLRLLSVPPLPAAVLAVAALDLSFYAAHVSWHKVPTLWRFHAVHHADPTLDVTTSIRQHPGESMLRFLTLAAAIVVIGPSAGAFAFYRVAAALNALLEHANLRVPPRLDRALALVTTWPSYHKIHHSRTAAETDSNYANLLSVWDRVFGTYTPAERAAGVVYGLDGMDDAELQTTRALLAHPFRSEGRPAARARTLA